MIQTGGKVLVDVIAHKIAIAAPCKANWDDMRGDESKRFCGGCSKHVYNLSAMSQSEAETFLRKAAAVPCLKFYRRVDGTILFENCPKGLRRIRDTAKATWRVASLAVAFALSILNAKAVEQKIDGPSNFNVEWTLSESGPLRKPAMRSGTSSQKAAPQGHLAQIGSVDRYFYLSTLLGDTNQTRGVGADWSGSDSFSNALRLAGKKKYKLAAANFEQSLVACSKPDSDPMYKQFVGIEYAKVLKKMGKRKKAEEILAQTKYPAAH